MQHYEKLYQAHNNWIKDMLSEISRIWEIIGIKPNPKPKAKAIYRIQENLVDKRYTDRYNSQGMNVLKE